MLCRRTSADLLSLTGYYDVPKLTRHLQNLRSGSELSAGHIEEAKDLIKGKIYERKLFQVQDENERQRVRDKSTYIAELVSGFSEIKGETKPDWQKALSYFLGEHGDARPFDEVMAS